MNTAFIKSGCRAAAVLAVIALSACNQVDSSSSPAFAGDVSSSVSAAVQQESRPAAPVALPESADASQLAESVATSARAQNPSEPSAPQSSASQSLPAFAPQPPPTASSGVSAIPALTDIEKFYARNPEQYTYVGTWMDFTQPQDYFTDFDREIEEGLSLFQGLTPTDEKLKISDCDFLIWTKDGVRHNFGLAGERLVADGRAYLLPRARADAVRLFHQRILELGKADSYVRSYPQWLAWMTPGNIQQMVFYSPVRGPLTINPVLADFVADAAALSVQPTGVSTYPPGSVDFSGSDVFHLELRFKTDVVYHIYAKNAGDQGYEADYYVQSSDMPFGCKYRTKLSSIYGAAQFMIDDYERVADAKSMKELINPAT